MSRLWKIIHMGELDGILVKPIDSQFAVSLWWINFSNIFRILMALGFTFWMIQVLHISISPLQVLLFVILAITSLVLLYSLWFLILTNLMWFSYLSNLVLFMYSFESMARFPKEMLAQLSSYIFVIVLPLALAINTPTRALLNKLTFSDVSVLFALAICFWVAARYYWRFALRHYTSASS